jgi:hypothetical protein
VARLLFVQAGQNATVLGTAKWFEETEFRIGRASDCQLRLMHADVAFHHAVLRADADALILQAASGSVLGSVDSPTQATRLGKPGDAGRIGPYRLTLAKLGDAGEFTVSIEQIGQVAEDEALLARHYFDAFESTLPNVRLWGFTLSCIIFMLLFVLRAAFAPHAPGHQTAALVHPTGAPRLGEVALVKVAELWNVGRISRAHGAFAGNCAYCHELAFVPVRSSACLACHQGVGRHADPVVAPSADIGKQRCEYCHFEHKGVMMATLDRQADCVACHGNIARVAPRTSLTNVLDFATDHPQFKPALVQDATLHLTKRFEIGDFSAEDHGNVRFTHATHLKLDKLKKSVAADGCAFCHEPTPGGVTFKPVRFDHSCASCHTLQFEPQHPEWRLPHGHPEEVADRVTGYYARAALAGETFQDPTSELFFKPGAPPPAAAPTGAAMVPYKTAQVMMSSIARSLCGYCHITVAPAAGQPASSWTVAPVFVPDTYMPSALFSHARHATTPCASCHAARSSDGGPVSLLPGIATCRSCHAGEAGGVGRVASTCASCHRFHDDRHPLIATAATATMTGARIKVDTDAMELRP